MRVCIVALSDATSDPRPRRHADLLQERGAEVTVIGYAGSQLARWSYRVVEAPLWTQREKLAHATRLLTARAARTLVDRAFWHSPGTQALLDAVRSVDADVYISHDLYALPVVARVAEEQGARYAYDAREFYSMQHLDRRVWRMLWPTYALALENRYIGRAAWVTTVGQGLARWLSTQHHLQVEPTVVRSIPQLSEPPAGHDPGDRWEVLFHGNLRPDRNIHGLVASVTGWAPHFHLTVRGHSDNAYGQQLKRLVDRLDLRERIHFEEPVPVSLVVPAAARADIGVIPWQLSSDQQRHAMPNKLFEYLAAGLAVVQTGPSEAGALVDEIGAGRWYEPADPYVLASTLNSITRDDLLRWRAAARAARRDLRWEREREKLWTLYESL